jgi:hypothetical protein
MSLFAFMSWSKELQVLILFFQSMSSSKVIGESVCGLVLTTRTVCVWGGNIPFSNLCHSSSTVLNKQDWKYTIRTGVQSFKVLFVLLGILNALRFSIQL